MGSRQRVKQGTKRTSDVNDRTSGNAFEFVIVAGARAKQLLQGCTPRIAATGSDKPIKVAQREVREGRVEKIRLPDVE